MQSINWLCEPGLLHETGAGRISHEQFSSNKGMEVVRAEVGLGRFGEVLHLVGQGVVFPGLAGDM